MAVGTIRHPDGVRPVELHRHSTKIMFCTTLRRVKKVSFDKNALMTDEICSIYPSTMNPPQRNYFPVEEFKETETSRIAKAFARQTAQNLFREVYES